MKKEIPILMSTQMVRAILAGRKTMTRRVIKQLPVTVQRQYSHSDNGKHYWKEGVNGVVEFGFRCPYGKVGDRLWVRESWTWIDGPIGSGAYFFKADDQVKAEKFRPSIHMPKEACRIWLKVTDVRVERLQDISEEDAKAEGVETLGLYPGYDISSKGKFEGLWNLINGDDAWDTNPWVWVIGFKVLNITGKSANL